MRAITKLNINPLTIDTNRKKLVIIMILAGVLLRCYHLILNRSLWGDEAHLAVNIIKFNYLRLSGTLDNLQSAPYAFLLATKFLGSQFDYSEWSLRLFSFLISCISLFLFSRICQWLFPLKIALLPIVLMSFSPVAIYHAVEAKHYATELACSIFLIYSLLGSAQNRFRHPKIYLYSLGFIFFFSFSSVFIFSSCLPFVWSSVRKKNVKTILPILGWWAVCFIVLYWMFIKPNSNVQQFIDMWGSDFIKIPYSRVDLYWYLKKIVFIGENPMGLRQPFSYFGIPQTHLESALSFSLSGLILLVLGTVYLAKTRQYSILYILLAPIILTFILSFLQKYPFHERFLLFYVPFAFLLITYGLKSINNRHIKIALTTLTMLPILISTTLNIIIKKSFGGYKFADHREALSHIAQHIDLEKDMIYVGWNLRTIYDYYNYRNHYNWKVKYGEPVHSSGSEQAVLQSIESKIVACKTIQDSWWYFLKKSYKIPYFKNHRRVSPSYTEAEIYHQLTWKIAFVNHEITTNTNLVFHANFNQDKDD